MGTRALYLAAAVTFVVTAAAGCSGSDTGAKAADAATAPAATATAATAPAATATVTVTASSSPSPSPSSPSSSPSVDLSQPPTTYAEAQAHLAAARDVTPGGSGALRFTSPSGNIYCDLSVPGCEIATGQVDDPSACPGGMTTLVGRIELQGDQPVAICNSDTIRQPGAPELSYGTSVTTRDTQCVSEQIGMTCVARGAHTGFFLAKGRYVLITS